MLVPPLLFALAAFWLLLSGHYSPLLLALGGISVALVLWLTRRMRRADSETPRLHITWRLIPYFAWLIRQTVIANVEVARRVLHPRLPVSPCIATLEVDLQNPSQLTLYVSSVTLTPDTVTLYIDERGRPVVHALWPESLQQLAGGEMQKRVRDTGV